MEDAAVEGGSGLTGSTVVDFVLLFATGGTGDVVGWICRGGSMAVEGRGAGVDGGRTVILLGTVTVGAMTAAGAVSESKARATSSSV